MERDEEEWIATRISGSRHHDTKEWNDAPKVTAYPYSRVSEVRVWSGQYVNGLRFTYECYDAKGKHQVLGQKALGEHGSFSEQTVQLDSDEHIVSVFGSSGLILDQFGFTTDKDRTLTFGGSGGSPFDIPIPAGHRVVFHGGVGGHIHNIGCFTKRAFPDKWQPENHHLFPPLFREAVKILMRAAELDTVNEVPRRPESLEYALPPEIIYEILQILAADPVAWLVPLQK